MKKILSFTAAIVFTLLSAIPVYAQEKTAESAPNGTDISVYAKYADNTEFTEIPTDNEGNGSVTLPNGTEITISGADKASGRIVVEEVTDEEVLGWIAKKLGDKANGLRVFYIYQIDESGKSQPISGVNITISLKNGTEYSVYSVSDSKTDKLKSTAENGKITFSTDGATFYALCENSKTVIPNYKSPQTGDGGSLILWFAMLLIYGGAVVATTVCGRKNSVL